MLLKLEVVRSSLAQGMIPQIDKMEADTMSDQSHVCFTLAAALEQAVEMENALFSDFVSTLQAVKSKAAKEILRDAALGKLEEKHQLERALLEGSIEGIDLQASVPIMRLDAHYGTDALREDAGVREALAYAIHLVTQAVDYYKNMAKACEGAPMSHVFARISGDQTTFLQALEDAYEEHFLTEN